MVKLDNPKFIIERPGEAATRLAKRLSLSQDAYHLDPIFISLRDLKWSIEESTERYYLTIWRSLNEKVR